MLRQRQAHCGKPRASSRQLGANHRSAPRLDAPQLKRPPLLRLPPAGRAGPAAQPSPGTTVHWTVVSGSAPMGAAGGRQSRFRGRCLTGTLLRSCWSATEYAAVPRALKLVVHTAEAAVAHAQQVVTRPRDAMHGVDGASMLSVTTALSPMAPAPRARSSRVRPGGRTTGRLLPVPTQLRVHRAQLHGLERGSNTARMRSVPTLRRRPLTVVRMAVGWWAKSS